jgi:hypothetical protein
VTINAFSVSSCKIWNVRCPRFSFSVPPPQNKNSPWTSYVRRPMRNCAMQKCNSLFLNERAWLPVTIPPTRRCEPSSKHQAQPRIALSRLLHRTCAGQHTRPKPASKLAAFVRRVGFARFCPLLIGFVRFSRASLQQPQQPPNVRDIHITGGASVPASHSKVGRVTPCAPPSPPLGEKVPAGRMRGTLYPAEVTHLQFTSKPETKID